MPFLFSCPWASGHGYLQNDGHAVKSLGIPIASESKVEYLRKRMFQLEKQTTTTI